jgi:hypothetical protein
LPNCSSSKESRRKSERPSWFYLGTLELVDWEYDA